MGKFLIKATITDKSGNVLSTANNSYSKTHPLQARFARDVGKPDSIFLHAEIAALIRLNNSCKPHKITVERYHKNGSPANARPCRICEKAIKHYGIKYIEYTV